MTFRILECRSETNLKHSAIQFVPPTPYFLAPQKTFGCTAARPSPDPSAPTSALVFRFCLLAGRRLSSFQHDHPSTRKVLRNVR